MKKISALFLAVILVLCLAVPAFADMGAPEFIEYNATVTNPDGAKTLYNDDDELIPCGAQVRVIGEYGNECSIFYENDYYSVNKNDLTASDNGSDVQPQKYDNKVTLKVMAKKGTDIKNGHGYAYKTIATIPEGTEFTVSSGDSASVFDGAWSWVSYEGNEGWVYTYPYDFDCGVAVKAEKQYGRLGRVTVLADGMRLMKKPGIYPTSAEMSEEDSSKFIGDVIPAGTVLTYSYYMPSPHRTIVFTEYNGVEGWFLEGDSENDLYTSMVTADSIRHLYMEKKLDMTEEPFGKGEVIASVPAGEGIASYCSASKVVNTDDGSDAELKLDKYGYYSYDYSACIQIYTYFVTYSGKAGWITAPYNDSECIKYIEWMTVFNSGEDLTFYADEDMTEELGKIPAGENFIEITRFYENNKLKVAYDQQIGYVYDNARFDYREGNVKENELIIFGKNIEEDFSFLPDEPETTETETAESDTDEPKTADPVKKTPSAKTFIITVAAAVAVVVLTAVVVIALVNKKKKK
ncbi:MAG: hypothetical protein MJ125_03735 [Clostridia bacterium]|nr:hypothetical protein [Clostridia bacterium]